MQLQDCGISYVIVNFCHMSYTSELVKKSLCIYVFKDTVALYTPVIFQNKMNLTSTLRETAVTWLCLRQKLKIRISAHSANIDIFSTGD